MNLTIRPPFAPMEALLADEIPEGPGWQYEPKWDGFRCLIYKDGASVLLQSKSGRPLGRYFPEAAAAAAALPLSRVILDAELVIPVGDALSFDDLLQRIHPAASRIAKLAGERPACLMVFDLLLDDSGEQVDEPLHERRRRLEILAGAAFGRGKGVSLSPATRDVSVARSWFHRTGAAI